MNDSSPIKRFTRQEREDYLKRFETSGLNAMRFAREHGLKYATLECNGPLLKVPLMFGSSHFTKSPSTEATQRARQHSNHENRN